MRTAIHSQPDRPPAAFGVLGSQSSEPICNSAKHAHTMNGKMCGPLAQPQRKTNYLDKEKQTMKIGAAVFIIISALSSSALLDAASHKLSPDLQGLPNKTVVDAIIQYKIPLTQAKHDAIRSHGGKLKLDLGGIQSLAITLPVGELELLAAADSRYRLHHTGPTGENVAGLRGTHDQRARGFQCGL